MLKPPSDLEMAHGRARHGVADQSAGQLVRNDLKGRKAAALVVWPRLACVHLLELPARV